MQTIVAYLGQAPPRMAAQPIGGAELKEAYLAAPNWRRDELAAQNGGDQVEKWRPDQMAAAEMAARRRNGGPDQVL